QLPTFVLGPFAGVVADRISRHKILVVTQILSMIQAFALAYLFMSGQIQIWHIFCLSIFLGLVNAFDAPTRQSFVVDMVERKEDIGNVIAVNSAIFNGARLIGPSVAGLIIAAFGEGWCFLLNAVSYSAVIAALLAMHIAKKIRAKKRAIFQELKEGFDYAYNFIPIRAVLLIIGLTSLMGMPYATLMPAYARDVLHGDSRTQGFLLACAGIGALSGALLLASRTKVINIRFIPFATTIFGCGLILLSSSRIQSLSMIFMVITGFGMMFQMASCNTFIQTIVDDDKRGRVMSFYAMAFLGTMPFGSLMAGFTASWITTPWTILLSGLFCILGALFFMRALGGLETIIKETYARKGIGVGT
ncbi:MAG: MFS transporter, partial [Candidatus Brocadiia bacterium]